MCDKSGGETVHRLRDRYMDVERVFQWQNFASRPHVPHVLTHFERTSNCQRPRLSPQRDQCLKCKRGTIRSNGAVGSVRSDGLSIWLETSLLHKGLTLDIPSSAVSLKDYTLS